MLTWSAGDQLIMLRVSWMRREAWPIASDACEWPWLAGVMVVREVTVVVRASDARVSARRQVASCLRGCWLLQQPRRGSVRPRRGWNSPRKARGVQRSGAAMMLFDGDWRCRSLRKAYSASTDSTSAISCLQASWLPAVELISLLGSCWDASKRTQPKSNRLGFSRSPCLLRASMLT